MVNLDWRVESRTGVSLVTLVIENPTGTPRRVRVANRLDGPVRPPRREGVREAGWDDGGFEGVVAAGESRPLGYASRAPPAEPPVELVWTERAGATERGKTERISASERDAEQTFSEEATPEDVVRALGDARPPADAVPTPTLDRDDTSFADPAPPDCDPDSAPSDRDLDSDVTGVAVEDADRRRSP